MSNLALSVDLGLASQNSRTVLKLVGTVIEAIQETRLSICRVPWSLLETVTLPNWCSVLPNCPQTSSSYYSRRLLWLTAFGFDFPFDSLVP